MTRHRVTLQDLSVILAVVLVATFLAFEFDIYENQASTTVREKTIELDEALTLGGLLCSGLLIFAVLTARRYQEQKLENRRRIAAEQHVRKLAFQDPLTGLANRRLFDEALNAAIAAPPGADGSHAVFLLDLNGFKQVNDVYGHGVGDEVLTVVAQRLSASVREGDLVGRLGGDEFAILSKHLMGAEAATNIAMRVLQIFDGTYFGREEQSSNRIWNRCCVDTKRRYHVAGGFEESRHRPLSSQIRTPLRCALL